MAIYVIGKKVAGNGVSAEPGAIIDAVLPSTGWVGNTQTVQNQKFVSSGYAYITNPASDDDFAVWTSCIVRGGDVVTDGQMTFTCEETPTEDIGVKIIRLEAKEE